MAEILVMLAGPFLGLGVTLLPAQILWINLLTHGVPGVALGVEPAERDVLSRPPRRPDEGILSGGLAGQVARLALVLAAASLAAGVWARLSGGHWQSVVFATLALGQLWTALAVRAGGRNRFLLVAVAVDAVLVPPALPSWPVMVFATVATATVYVLLPSGRWRRHAFAGVAALVLALSLSRMYLGLDNVTGDVWSALIGSGVAALAFTLLAPESDFPVTYRRRNRAHLELTASRVQRIVDAVAQQLGLVLTEITPYRLAGSAGSTPCRLRVDGAAEAFLFGKLYATSHLRSDRWYKFIRLLRYGALEDEGPFASVRRLVEHEDYMLRLFRDHGVHVPQPYGVAEIIPGREYLLVTQLLPDTVEVLDADPGDEVIDDGLRQIRRMWDAGVAHRDVKPSNVLVQERRHTYLVDVAFGELRPSPWRQAVDLANMMLTLALIAGAEKVYARAVRVFDPHEIAEAFAASGSVTIPRQLQRLVAESGGDLVAQFRSLAPQHPPIAIQRWSVRRVRLAVFTVAAAVIGALVLLVINLRAGQLI